MYLNMFKRDLKDQKGLNAVLFVFMIAAAVAMVTIRSLWDRIRHMRCVTVLTLSVSSTRI